MHRFLTLSVGSLAIAACAPSKTPVQTVSQHPPVQDLVCSPEPRALTDAEVLADTDGSADARFNDNTLMAGRSCRDALARACRWHQGRGMQLPDGVTCGGTPFITKPVSLRSLQALPGGYRSSVAR